MMDDESVMSSLSGNIPDNELEILRNELTQYFEYLDSNYKSISRMGDMIKSYPMEEQDAYINEVTTLAKQVIRMVQIRRNFNGIDPATNVEFDEDEKLTQKRYLSDQVRYHLKIFKQDLESYLHNGVPVSHYSCSDKLLNLEIEYLIL